MVNPKESPHRAWPARVEEAKLPMLVRRQWSVLKRLMVVYPGDTVLDAHCMEGTLLRQLLLTHPNVQGCGACFTPPQARYARQLVREADIMFADEEDFPWVNQSMDVVYISRGFHALENPSASLREVSRVLKSGGQFLLAALWAPQPLRFALNRALFAGRERVRIRSRKELTALLEAAGFELIYFRRVCLFGCVISGLKR